jgi:hypothetical protein
MFHRPWRLAALALLLAAGLLVGCKSKPVAQNTKPSDPLLFSGKKPLEGRAQTETTESAARLDPQPPAMPLRERQLTVPARLDVAVDRPEVRLGPPTP